MAQQPSPLQELVCGVCLTDLLSPDGGALLGELDCCNHRWVGAGRSAAATRL